jgi:hypothetical protein
MAAAIAKTNGGVVPKNYRWLITILHIPYLSGACCSGECAKPFGLMRSTSKRPQGALMAGVAATRAEHVPMDN